MRDLEANKVKVKFVLNLLSLFWSYSLSLVCCSRCCRVAFFVLGVIENVGMEGGSHNLTQTHFTILRLDKSLHDK
jgi:hypothetical protein